MWWIAWQPQCASGRKLKGNKLSLTGYECDLQTWRWGAHLGWEAGSWADSFWCPCWRSPGAGPRHARSCTRRRTNIGCTVSWANWPRCLTCPRSGWWPAPSTSCSYSPGGRQIKEEAQRAAHNSLTGIIVLTVLTWDIQIQVESRHTWVRPPISLTEM